MIVSNIGTTPDFSAIYTTNSGPHTAFVQVSLKDRRTQVGSYEYMDRVRAAAARASCRSSAPTSSPAAWWMRCSTSACRRRSTCR